MASDIGQWGEHTAIRLDYDPDEAVMSEANFAAYLLDQLEKEGLIVWLGDSAEPDPYGLLPHGWVMT